MRRSEAELTLSPPASPSLISFRWHPGGKSMVRYGVFRLFEVDPAICNSGPGVFRIPAQSPSQFLRHCWARWIKFHLCLARRLSSDGIGPAWALGRCSRTASP